MAHFGDMLLSLVTHAGYLGLFIVMVLGNLAVPVGAEVILPLAGALTASGHLPNLALTMFVALAGELVGGSLLYAVGRYGGLPLAHRFGRAVNLREEELNRVHGFYAHYGMRMVFFSRFIPLIRGISALPAGLSELEWPKFLIYTAFGSGIFCSALIALGYSLGNTIPQVEPVLHKVGTAIAVIVVLCIVGLGVGRQWFRTRSAK